MITILITGLLVIMAAALASAGYIMWRRVLRFAKGIERGLKMVPLFIHLPPASDDAEVGGRDVREVVQERISQAEILYNLIASTAKKGFKSKFYGQRHIAFEIVALNGVIRFYTAVPIALVEIVKQAVLTAYPGASLEEVEEHNLFSPTGKITGTIGGEIILKQDYAYPIATFTLLKRDAMQALITAMSTLDKGDGAGLQILLRPAHSGWSKHAQDMASKKRKKKDKKKGIPWRTFLEAPIKTPEQKESSPEDKQLSSTEQALVEAIEEKTRHPGYEVMIRIITSSSTAARSQAILHNLTAAFGLFDAPGMNGFKFSEAKDIKSFVTSFIFRFFPPEENKNILNSVELATLFHFPDAQFTSTSQLERQMSKQVEGPIKVSPNGILLGHNIFRGVKREIRVSPEDRMRHMYIVGQTGTGKSTLLENMVVQDMIAGHGFAFVDPHGDTAEKLLSMVPKERTEDVIYFDPGDMANPMGLNLFEFQTPDQKDFLIQETINMLYKLYDPTHSGIMGPRYEHLFRNAALTAMADPAGGSFIDIPKLFRDPQYVNQKLPYITDQNVIDFWKKEMPQSQRSNEYGEVVSWFVSKFGAFLSNEMMRNIIGQSRSAFDIRQVMDTGKILIVNLSKGRLGELNSMLLGMIFVMKFQAAAMSRANIPNPEDRRPFYLYVDEFQNFATSSFATILSEARKYKLSLTVANQYISQLTEEVRDSVFGNVGTAVSFRSSPSDADFLVKQFAPVFEAQDIVKLPNFQTILRLMINGLPSQPFSMATLPPVNIGNPQMGIALKQLSAAKYGRPRVQVEADIFKRLETKAPPAPSPFGQPGTGSPMAPNPLGGSPLGGAGTAAGGSSFLDDWLAKRKSAQAAGPRSGSLRQDDPMSPFVKPQAQTDKPKDPARETKPPQPRELEPAAPVFSEPPAAGDKEGPSDNKIKDPEPRAVQNTESEPAGQSATAPAPLVSADAPDKPKDTMSDPGKPEPVSKRKPGEIYVDENGIIHQG